VFELNETTGNQAFGQAQVLDNFPVSIQDGIYLWTSTGVRDERNASLISQRVKQTLSTFTMSGILTYDWEQNREYWVAYGATVLVYNYQIDVWYKFVFSDIIKSMNTPIVEDFNHVLTAKEAFGLFVNQVGDDVAKKQFNFFKKAYEQADISSDSNWNTIYISHFSVDKDFVKNDIANKTSILDKVKKWCKDNSILFIFLYLIVAPIIFIFSTFLGFVYILVLICLIIYIFCY
jgi:hypothetical protein